MVRRIGAARPIVARGNLARALAVSAWLLALYACGARQAAEPEARPAAPSPPARNDRQERGLAGEVSQVTTRLFRPPQAYGSDPAERSAWTLWSYSIDGYGRDGFLTEQRAFDAQNRLTGLSIRERDRDGVPSGLAMRGADGSLEARCAYRYDKAGRLVREEWYDGSGTLTGWYDYEYDSKGRLARRRMETRYSDGSVGRMETAYAHDERGRLVAEDHIDPRYEGVSLRLEYAYDGERLSRTLHLQRGRWLEGVVFFSYDARGNLAHESSYQIPESVDDAPFRRASSPGDIPIAYVSSERRYEYRYY